MTKRKNKRFKRIFAIFSLVLVLAFTLTPFSVSAFSIDSLNFSFLSNANLIDTPTGLNSNYPRSFALTSFDPSKGSFTFTTKENILNSTSAVLSVPFKELAPYVSVGDVVYISWDVDNPSLYTDVIQFLNNKTFGDFYKKGNALTVTQEILDAYFVFYPFEKEGMVGETCTYSSFRCNYDGTKEFAPYQETQRYIEYIDGLYNDGYNNGSADFETDYINNNFVLTSKNFVEAFWHYTDYNLGSYTESIDMNNYAYNGRIINSLYLSKAPEGREGFELNGLSFHFKTEIQGNYQALADIPLIFYGVHNDGFLSVSVMTSSGLAYQLANFGCDVDDEGMLAVDWSKATFLPIGDEGFSSLDAVSLPDTTIITDIAISVYSVSPFLYFSISNADGYVDGFDEGYSVGVEEGADIAYSNGYEDGYSNGEHYGIQTGWNNGYAEGNRVGYNKGFADGQGGTGWYNLFSAAVSAPVDMLSQMLNFEIFGVNMNVFFTSIITVCCLVAIIRFVI